MYLTAVHASPHEINKGKRRFFPKPKIIKQMYRDLGRNTTAQPIVISNEIVNFVHQIQSRHLTKCSKNVVMHS